jgi:predicted branched-subunit amino acid permease
VPAIPERDDRLLGRAAIIGVAVAAFGVAFGVAAVESGMSPWLTVLTSVLVFAGASQFAFVALAAASDPVTGALSGILLNLRIIAFSFALAPRLPGGPLGRRLIDGYLITDESAAVAFDGPVAGTRRRLWVTGASVGLFWVGATTLGAFGGGLIGDVRVYGLDVAFPAAFVALLAPSLRARTGALVGLAGAALTGVAMQLVPTGLAVFAAGLAVVPLLRRRHGPVQAQR